MTPAESLREAAKRIREVAKDTAKSPWHVELLGQGTTHPGYPQRISNAQAIVIAETWISPEVRPNDAEHIALWHPGVALLVAAWLESEADDADHEAANSIYGAAGNDFVYNAGDGHPALILARAILGGRP